MMEHGAKVEVSGMEEVVWDTEKGKGSGVFFGAGKWRAQDKSPISLANWRTGMGGTHPGAAFTSRTNKGALDCRGPGGGRWKPRAWRVGGERKEGSGREINLWSWILIMCRREFETNCYAV